MRLRLFPRSLRARIAVSFAVLLLITATVVTIAFARQAAQSQLEAQHQLTHNLMTFVEPAVRGMVANYEIAGLDDYMSKMAADPAIASIRILDESGGSLLYKHEGNSEPASWLTRTLTGTPANNPLLISKVAINGIRVGRIEATLSYAPLNQSIRRVVAVGGMLTAASLAAVFLLTFLLLNRFTAPLRPLMQWAREFAHGNWNPPPQIL